MKIETTELLNLLEVTSIGVTSKSLIEHFTQLTFIDEGIITYDGKLFVFAPVKTDINCSINFDDFNKSMSSIPKIMVELTHKNGQLRVTGKNERFGIVALNESQEFAFIKEILKGITKEDWLKLPRTFLEGLNFCKMSLSDDINNFNLFCVNVTKKGLVSSDNLRISFYKCSGIRNEFLLSKDIVDKLTEIPITHYCLKGPWILFKTSSDVVVGANTVCGEYPDVTNLFDIKGTEIELPSEIKTLLEDTKIFSKDNALSSGKVNIKIKDKLLVCRSENSKGWIEKDIKVKDDTKVNIIINPEFLLQILSKTNKMVVSDDKSKAFFETDRFLHAMVLPIQE